MSLILDNILLVFKNVSLIRVLSLACITKSAASFYREFMDGYLDTLKRRCGTKRIQANVVYQDYISWREHVHMNATQWETLTDFVKWLGKEGIPYTMNMGYMW